MPTEEQINASRLNGAKSLGPATEDGKARSSRNSTRHGALAKAVVFPGESRRLFNELVDKLNGSLHPENDMDNLLIGKMAAAHWRQLRIWESEKAGQAQPPDLEMRLDRQFHRSLDRYMRLRVAKTFFEQTNPRSV